MAAAVIEAGHKVVVVSGPVDIAYPEKAEVVSVQSTEEMLEQCLKIFPACDGLIAAAAPCDYRPLTVARHKIRKTGDPLKLQLVETPDVVAQFGAAKNTQWMVAFALETDDPRMRAMQKLERKNCDLIVVNGPQAVGAADTQVEVLDISGQVAGNFAGSKHEVAKQIFHLIEERLIQRTV